MNTTNIKQTLLQWKDAALSIDLSKFKPTNRKTALIATAIFAGIIAVPTIAYFALRNRKVTNAKQEAIISSPIHVKLNNSQDTLIFGKSTNLFKKLGVPFPDDLPKLEDDLEAPFSITTSNNQPAISVGTGERKFILFINDNVLTHCGKKTETPLVNERGDIINQQAFAAISDFIKNLSEHSE